MNIHNVLLNFHSLTAGVGTKLGKTHKSGTPGRLCIEWVASLNVLTMFKL